MFIVHVFVHVKAEQIDAFKAATLENARNSVQEPGIARFDVVQQRDDPTRFVLVEVYRTPDDPARSPEHHISRITGKPDFQGYRIYRFQGETFTDDPFELSTLVAEYDKIDGVGFDIAAGETLAGAERRSTASTRARSSGPNARAPP